MITFEQSIGWKALEERLARTESLDGLMKTLVPEPNYHFWRNGKDVGPKGYDGVRKYYEDFVASGAAVLTSVKERIVVDDDSITHEGVISTLGTGKIAKARGYNVDDESAHYLMRARTNILWSFDEDGLASGEDSYGSSDPDDFDKIAVADLPQVYVDYLARLGQRP